MNDKELDQAVKDGWVTKKQREKIPNRSYLVYLAKKNKETGHKPKPSMTTEEWAKHQASKASNSKTKHWTVHIHIHRQIGIGPKHVFVCIELKATGGC
jgi:hypothetical protein